MQQPQSAHGGVWRLDAVLFDWDDTLVESFPLRLAAVRHVFDELQLTTPTADEFLHSLQGKSLEFAAERLEAQIGRPLDIFNRYVRAYWTNPEKHRLLHFFPGIQAVLTTFRSRGVKLGIVTQKLRTFGVDGCAAGLQAELVELDVVGLFDAVVGYEDVKQPKPDPEAVCLAMRMLGATPERTLVVGDSAADMAAGRSAGCRTCLALWGAPVYGTTVEATRPDFTADAPEDLLCLG